MNQIRVFSLLIPPDGVGVSSADVGSDLRFATSRGAEYVKTTFEILLRQWFDLDSIK